MDEEPDDEAPEEDVPLDEAPEELEAFEDVEDAPSDFVDVAALSDLLLEDSDFESPPPFFGLDE